MIDDLVKSIKDVVKKPVRPLVRKLRRQIHEQTWRRLNLEWTLRSGITIKVINHCDWVLYNDIFVEGEYDLPIKNALQSGADRGCLNILDLGANVGFFVLRVIDLFQGSGSKIPYQFSLVEASNREIDDLRSRLASQNLLSDNINLIHGLIGQKSGTGQIGEQEFHGMNSVFFNQGTRGTNVEFIDLTGVLEGSEIDLLKCDIEGSELIFLENYWDSLGRVKAAVFEFHHDLCDPSECTEYLRKAGFVNSQVLTSHEKHEISTRYFWR
ncbi:MAG: hypothetical protein COB20_03370 [SAR86 cluster bacterium]|uniref:Methyltransferase FkbM domain-containing protein n=1 Tax=SAR86 cluster bacterium TaxID=2030880 RepID=A0A2A4XC83_9GAMM|nr:MAG: hypothetical protein COB20_03370 [SAR86 cluster bacterium]